ncbi:germ cell-specific gene 1-like protein isoform X2 [Cyprinodon tularosa]|uniref:germ cell-specific gene 1-like protein isoform X2 n=1 Tax=Cyprinodon tularosa TaxID=77115 RepID=UPI0018E1E24A|nr:germ cell-specific gene 1-like protein isoform X2 [Cyprinodon tularosa]
MLEKMSRRNRTLLSLGLTSLALTMSVSAFCTSYWCEGTHKVVKPICLSPVKLKNCGKNNSQPYTTEAPTVDPSSPVSNVTLSPKQKEELALLRKKQLANAVQYLWETGEDKYMLRYFHTGFWLSCEKHNEGDDQEEKCRSFIELTPGETQGVLWLAVISLMGMVAHMMYTTVFQMTVSIGPKDWRPQSWDYGWSFALAWLSFSCCMAAAVATLNSYTKTIIEMKHRARLRLEEARAATIAPPYEEVVRAGGGSLYSISQLVQLGQQGALMDPLWPRGVGPAVGPLACSAGGALLVGAGVGGIGMGMGGAGPGGIPAMGGVVGVGVEGGVGMGRGSSGGTMGTMAGAKMGTGRMMNTHRVVVVGGCTTEGCTECEREMDEIDYTLREGREDSLC